MYHGNQSDADTLKDSVNTAQGHLLAAGSEAVIEEAVADKGYHRTRLWRRVASRACEHTSANRTARAVAGRTSRMATKKRTGPTADASLAIATNVCRGSAANAWNGASPTSAKPAAAAAPGCEASRTTANRPTYEWPLTTWV